MAGKFARKNNKDDFYSYEISGKEKEYHTTQFARWTGNLSNVQATGGVISDFESPTGDIWRVHTFSGSGTFSVTGTGENPDIPSINDIEYMIIAGGGGGGANWGSGGGAGGVITNQSGHNMTNGVTFPLSIGSYPIVVGAGGACGVPGAATTAFSQTAEGGGRGSSAASPGAGIPAIIGAEPGGSGGGGGWPGAAVPSPGGTGTAGQGNPGGDGEAAATPYAGEGGGGGASQAGTNAIQGPSGPQWASCGWGGIGTAFDFDGGGEVWYAGGGGSMGSATYTFLGTFGGRGGSGDGSQEHPVVPNRYGEWNNAVDNRGGGGGGNTSNSSSYGKGGSGIVRVRYKLGAGTAKNKGAKATGGRVFLDPSGPVYYHCFDSSGTFDVLSPITGAEVLMLGGGGAGGVHLNSFGCSGGGGAGGALHKASLTIPVQTYPIVIGAGGAGTKNTVAGLGQTTTAFGIEALGGGSGRSQSHGSTNPGAGGCGGGGGYSGGSTGGPATQSPDTSPAPLLNVVFDGYGNAGGDASPPAPMGYEGGGGGGTGEVGDFGRAGRGQPFSNFAKAFLPSAPGYYGGGGGTSGAYTYTAPTGYACSGMDGGGHGADMYGGTYPMPDDSRWRRAEPGVAGSGSGGGSGGLGDSTPADGALPSGNGGSGVVIIMYPS